MNLFENFSREIVCPMKMRYSLYDLGPVNYSHGKRHDFTTHNHQNQHMFGSFYRCSAPKYPDICVLYLHSMNGSRLQSSTYVDTVLRMGLSFCCFDFSGCGNSEGDSISFGASEKYDIAAVVATLKQKFKTKKFVLWGRSMGSAAALKYCEHLIEKEHPDIQSEIMGVILDSCFKSFSELAVEIGSSQSDVPQFLVKLGYRLLKSSIQQKGQFKTDELQLQKVVESIDVPILFLTSQDDKTVSCEHSKCLFQCAPHPRKEIAYFQGAHNEARDSVYLGLVTNYIEKAIQHSLIPTRPIKMGPVATLQLKSSKRLPDDSIQFEQESTTCHCSFFGGNRSSDVEITDGVPTTRRKYSETSLYRVKNHRREVQFRSTSNISLNYA